MVKPFNKRFINNAEFAGIADFYGPVNFYTSTTYHTTTVFATATTFNGIATYNTSSTYNGVATFNTAPAFNGVPVFNTATTFNGIPTFNTTVTLNGNLLFSVASVTADTTLTETLYYNFDATAGTLTATVPTATTLKTYIVKKVDASANPVMIVGTGDEISGVALTTQYDVIKLIPSGGNWYTW